MNALTYLFIFLAAAFGWLAFLMASLFNAAAIRGIPKAAAPLLRGFIFAISVTLVVLFISLAVTT